MIKEKKKKKEQEKRRKVTGSYFFILCAFGFCYWTAMGFKQFKVKTENFLDRNKKPKTVPEFIVFRDFIVTIIGTKYS